MIKLLIILLFTNLILGCSKPDPLADFKPIVEEFYSQKLELPEMTNTKAGTISDIQYNIEVTNSLISPFIGTLSFNFEYPRSDEDIKALPGLSDIIDTDGKCEVSFAYQDEEWIVKNVDVKAINRKKREFYRRRAIFKNQDMETRERFKATDSDLNSLKSSYRLYEIGIQLEIVSTVSEFLAKKEGMK